MDQYNFLRRFPSLKLIFVGACSSKIFLDSLSLFFQEIIRAAVVYLVSHSIVFYGYVLTSTSCCGPCIWNLYIFFAVAAAGFCFNPFCLVGDGEGHHVVF